MEAYGKMSTEELSSYDLVNIVVSVEEGMRPEKLAVAS
jgi:hypothetical protein